MLCVCRFLVPGNTHKRVALYLTLMQAPHYSSSSLSASLDTQDTLQGSTIVKEISARYSSVQLISTYAQTPCIFELTQCIYKIIESGPILVKGYVKVRKFAIPMRFKSLHLRMQSIWGDEPKDEHGTYTNIRRQEQ